MVFPVGAYGGRRELMNLVAPAGPVYQAGTLSANPVAMCAGLAALQQLADGRLHAQLDVLGARLERALAGVSRLRLQRVASIFWICIDDGTTAAVEPLRSPAAIPAGAAAAFRAIHAPLLERGIYLAPHAFEVGFLSAANTDAHVDALAAAIKELV